MAECFRQRNRKAYYVATPVYYNLRYILLNLCIMLNCIALSFGLPLGRSDNTVPSLWQSFSTENNNIIRIQRQHQQQQVAVVPPHCSKAIVTESQSSRLTRRSTTASGRQMSVNIGVAQTICFRVDDSAAEGDNSVETFPPIWRTESGSERQRRVVRPLRKNYAALRVARQKRTNENNNVTMTMSEKDLRDEADDTDENRTENRNRMVNATSEQHSGQLLHTVTVVELEQYYAITERYQFAIPEVETNCICECNPMAATCQADEWQYGDCAPIGAVASADAPTAACHRTFFPNQPSGGCPTSGGSNNAAGTSSSRLCCQLRFRAHRNRVFTALRLEPTTSHAILQYSVYEYQTSVGDEPPRWTERDKRRISVQLDGMVHNSVLDVDVGLKLSILGFGGNSAPVQLETGMYYVENLPDGEFSEIRVQPLNRITEHDFHKLGWLRVANVPGGRTAAFVQSGDIFLDKIHHAKTNNCAEQRFRSVLDSSYYVNRDEQLNNATTEFRLAEPLNVAHSWIRSARVLRTSSLRQAVVRAGEGVNLDVTLTLPQSTDASSERRNSYNRHAITFVHNSSRIVDFTGVIFVDRYSNSFLNLSLYGARGVLNGYVHQVADWDGENIDTFSFTVPQQQQISFQQRLPSEDVTTIVERIKPYPINSVQIVCLRPDDADLSAELCRPVQSVELELEVNTVRNDWSHRVGSCAECNKITVEGFMKYLNPLNWTKGITSVGDALMLASDVVLYAFIFVALYFIIAKVLIPLACCCLCPMQAFYAHTKALAKAVRYKPKSKQATAKNGSERSNTKLTPPMLSAPPRGTPKMRAKRTKR